MDAQGHGKPFKVTNLDVFKRPGVKVEPRFVPRVGCTIAFKNGYTVSLFFEDEGETAEVGVFKPGPHNDLVRFMDGETVQFGCSMERVQRILDLLSVDALMRPYQPPTPPVEMRADDR